MTPEELTDVSRKIHVTFPAVAEWFGKLRPAQQEAVRDRRRATLMDLQASDVLAAIAEYAASTDCPWGGYGQTEYVYAHIATKARQIAASRASKAECETTIERGKRTAPGVRDGESLIMASDLVKSLVEAKQRGECQTAAEICAFFDRESPPSERDDGDRREWAQCRACRDSGLLPVVSSLRQREHRLTWTATSVACECPSGSARNAARKDEQRIATYDDCEHVRLVPFAQAADVLSELGRVNERRATRNREPSFDAFNERGAVA